MNKSLKSAFKDWLFLLCFFSMVYSVVCVAIEQSEGNIFFMAFCVASTILCVKFRKYGS